MPKRVYGWNENGEYESFIGGLPEGYSMTDPNAPKRRGRPPKERTEDDAVERVEGGEPETT